MRILGMILLLLLFVAACAPGVAPAASPLTEAQARALILSQPLVSVRTGERFRLGQLGGVTIVMNAAIW